MNIALANRQGFFCLPFLLNTLTAERPDQPGAHCSCRKSDASSLSDLTGRHEERSI